MWKRLEGELWEEATRTKKTASLVMGLKPQREYEFKVVATNSLIMGLEGRISQSGTMMSKAQHSAHVAGFGGVLYINVVCWRIIVHSCNGERSREKYEVLDWILCSRTSNSTSQHPTTSSNDSHMCSICGNSIQ